MGRDKAQQDIHQPIKNSNQTTEGEKKGCYSTIAIFIGIALITFGFGIYCITLAPDAWYATIIIFIIGIMFLFFAYILYLGLKHGEESEKRFELNEKGIFVYHIHHKAGTEEKVSIPFESIKSVIIGNNANYTSMPVGKGISFYRFGAIMVIKHENGIFIQQFFEQQEFHDWILRLEDKGCPLFKTEYDLGPAIASGPDYEVDFSKLVGLPWRGAPDYPPIGDEKLRNPFSPWEIGVKKREGVEENKRMKTRKWEKRVNWLLLGYALIVGGVIMPTFPLDEDGILAIDDPFIFGVLPFYILIPFFLVFWRSYAKWYLPFLYFVIMTAGNSFGALLVSIFADIPAIYLSAIAINLFVLVMGLIPSFLFIKVIKFLGTLRNKSRRY